MKAKFNYPEEFVTLPDYTKHAGQLVKVGEQVTPEEGGPTPDDGDVEQMFWITAEDGWTGQAFESELDIRVTVGKENGEGKLFYFSTIKDAEEAIALLETVVPASVHAGDYFIDVPEEIS